MADLNKSAREQAEKYAARERKNGTPESVIIDHIINTVGIEKNATIHDILFPNETDKSLGAKKSKISRLKNM